MILGNRDSPCSAVIRRASASALVASSLLSCHSYRPVPAATLDSGSPREYGRILVVTREGYELELVHAFIRADSVVGFVKGKETGLLQKKSTGERRAFSRDQIARVESYERDRKETVQQATTPPPGADLGGVGGVFVCALTMGIVCIPSQAPSPVPSPAPEPTPPSTPPAPPSPTP